MTEHTPRTIQLTFAPMEMTLTATCTLSVEHMRPPNEPPNDAVFERLWWWLLIEKFSILVDVLLQFSTPDSRRALVAPRPSPTPRCCRSGQAIVV